MKLIVEHKTATAHGTMPPQAVIQLQRLEGRRQWLKPSGFRFETSQHNIRLFRTIFPEVEIEDNRKTSDAFDFGQGVAPETGGGDDTGELLVATPRVALEEIDAENFPFRVKPYDFQLQMWAQFKDKPIAAIFAEQGTGKTKTAIDLIAYKYLQGEINAVIVFTIKGVHHQWVEEQLTRNMPESVPYQAEAWDGKRFGDWVEKRSNSLAIITVNIDMIIHKRGFTELMRFINAHSGKIMMIVDESQLIKNKSSKRHKVLMEIRHHSNCRIIMTGTPIARDLTDEWSQFYWLDENIIGIKYKTAFQAQFCRMGGFEGRSVIGHRNISNFKALTAPHIFRATKEQDLNLPPKVYDQHVFELSDVQKRHMKELKENFMTQLADGSMSTVRVAVSLLVRAQQISCGYILDEDGRIHELPNPRMDALDDLLQSRSGKIVIWARFNRDIENIAAHLKGRAVTYYGPTSTGQRAEAKARFLDPSSGIDYFIGNPAAAGTGVDGLQTVSNTAIYYSNSFNALERWQSEDRIDRIGMSGHSTYFDLIARGGPDRKILANLRKKKSLSDLVLDDFKSLFEEM